MRFLLCSRPRGVHPNTLAVPHFIHDVARHLLASGHEVLIVYVVRFPNVSEREWLKKEGISWENWVEGRVPNRIGDVVRLMRIARKFQPDLAEFHFSAAPLGLIVCSLCRVPQRVVWYHTMNDAAEPQNIWQRAWESLMLKRSILIRRLATHHIANSYAAKAEYAHLFKTPVTRISVSHLGIRLSSSSSISRDREGKRLVCVSRMTRMKGQHVIVQALCQLAGKYPQLRATFAGGGDSARLQSMAESLGVASRCEFLGTVNRETVYALFSNATIVAFPTLAEAFGLVAVEALACGACLIASGTGGITEVVEHGKSGYLVPPGDVDSWAKAIDMLLNDDNLRAHLQRNARLRAQCFDVWERAASHSNLLANMVEESSRDSRKANYCGS